MQTSGILIEPAGQSTPPLLVWQPSLPSKPTNDTPLHAFHRLDLRLEWPEERPQLDTLFGFQDWSIYVWQPYNQRPRMTIARITNVTADGSQEFRLVMITTSGMAMKALKREPDELVESQAINVSSTIQDQLLVSILAAVRVIVSDVVEYMKRSIKLVQQIVR